MAQLTFKDFMEDGGLEASGAVLGDVAALATSNSKYKGGQRGRAIGGGVGTAVGAAVGVPGVGQAVGSLIGGLIGGASDKKKMIEDYEDTARKRYQPLHLSANVNPYGNAGYMEEGGAAGFDPMALAGGAMGALTQLVDTTDTENVIDQMMGNLPVFAKKGGMVKKKGPKYMAGGGFLETGDPVDPNKPIPKKVKAAMPAPGKQVFTSEEEIQAANQWTRDFLERHNAPQYFVTNAVAARKVGDPVPQFVGTGRKQPMGATSLPSGVTINDVENTSEGYGFWHPQNGNFVRVDPASIYTKYGQTKTPTVTVPAANVVKLKKGGMIKKYEAGGLTEGGGEPVRELINIEKGEILIDPVTLDVLREYENPNRYKEHNKNPMKEPVGNFTMIEQGKVVIPKKFAERFKKGDILTRKSIVGEILKNQINNPEQNDPRQTTDARFAQAGIVSGSGEKKSKAMLFDWTGSIGTPGIIPEVPGAPVQNRYPFAKIDDTAVDGLPQFPVNAINYSDPNIAGQQPGDPSPAVNVGTKKLMNKKMIASKLMSALPTAYGITNALGIDPFLRYDENTQFDNAKAYASAMETEPNIDASLAAIRRTNANRNKVLNNFNSPSVRAEVASGHASALGAEAGVIQNKENLAMELRNRKRETLGNLEVAQGSNRLDMRRQLMNELRMDKATRENLVHQGISEGVTNFQQGVMDEERIKSINSVAEFYQIDPYQASLLVDQHAFMPYVTDALGKLAGNVPGTPKMVPTTEVGKVTRDRVGNVKTTQQITVRKPRKG